MATAVAAAVAPPSAPGSAPAAAGAAGGRGVDGDPTGEELERLLEELLVAYKAPALQQELSALRRKCLEAKASPLLLMGPLVLAVQAPILEKFGLPPTAQGVDLMKHAVERRVAEGHPRLVDLASAARSALGLAPLPNRTATAEQVLAAKVDETSARFGLASAAAAADRLEVERELARQCGARIATEAAAGALPGPSATYLQALLEEGEAPVPSVLSLLKMAKLGIALPDLRGDSAAGLPEFVPVLESPASGDFFREHVLPNRPAVLRGALDSGRFPPLRDFHDTAFLRRVCGHRRVVVKSLAHEDKAGRPVFVSDPELRLPLTAFLDALDAHERDGSRQPFYLGKVPLKKELPELAEAIEAAETCPRRLYGDCFGAMIPNGVYTYFGCSRNTTPVHWDAHDNLLLCLCGSKRFFLYPPSDARWLYPCNDFSRSAVLPFARFADLAPELREKFALMEGARPLEVTVTAGDMLYLPSSWWHCVEGSDERNMILNWWFEFHPEKRARAFGPAGTPGSGGGGAAAAAA